MIVIIGYGNPLRCDDGIGYETAQCLMDLISDRDVLILARHQLTLELIAPISMADAVYFIDARRGDCPGQIQREPVMPFAQGGVFTHHVSPAVLLESARLLYGAKPASWLYTVCGTDFELGAVFSDAVQAAMHHLIEDMLGQVSSLKH
jgi:hydrogenase maturation protease